MKQFFNFLAVMFVVLSISCSVFAVILAANAELQESFGVAFFGGLLLFAVLDDRLKVVK